ncbi:multidrug ABC transporter ATP-binding protein [Chryseomicrobium excrementi]|uniref:Multidrug ABC transporter ATP-binding protein n=1 Tax=Chryseomicrobium excrementi TaxID=2041346 RepID=A0A2M9F2L3_9BACL|nr:ABC-F family ATP-binding cassette domain-containing protein [Chryseomicrobium excrementi]PJK17701.1 multidrug ABC transporter ATP-binding protein [Chryseomicrobium excrementi]
MSQLIIQSLTKTVGEKMLFDSIEFTIYKGEKIGLVGKNGSGKSTLLQILAKRLEADQAVMDHPKDYSISYLEQQPILPAGKSVLESMFSGDLEVMRLNRAYEEARLAAELDSSNMKLIETLLSVQQQMEEMNGWEVNTAAKQALTKLGIEDFNQDAGTLSGGQQKRVALARALIEPHDLLLLDEPTNHLDVESTVALEELVKSYKGAVLFVTHDRVFLDQISTSILEIDQQQLFRYKGNYEQYLENKAIRYEQQQAEQSKIQNLYRNELKWVRRGAKARTTKQKARLDRFDDIQEKAKQKVTVTDLEVNLSSSRLGKKVMEGHHLGKQFGDRRLFDDFSFLLQNKDRIGIVGENGAGKTTLFSILAGLEEPTSGVLDRGQTVKIGYFTQELPEFDSNQRVLHYITEESNSIESTTGERFSAVQMLEQFLFPTSTHGTQIRKLSGGEKKRLFLLKLLIQQPNVLLLDEPTNDLDLDTLTVLENYLDTFPGVVLTISHDRYFVDRVTNKLWILENGRVTQTLDSFEEYLEQKKVQVKEEKMEEVTASPEPEVKEKKKRLFYNEKKEWETIEDEIAKLEQRISELQQEIDQAGSNYESIRVASIELEEKEAILEEKMERWAYLEEIVSS